MEMKALSTFNQDDAIQNSKTSKIKNKYNVSCMSLKTLFNTYINEIDFLSIDVEGYELSVLNSNDWQL